MSTRSAASAVNRFGLGARPGELQDAAADAPAWLHAQLRETPDTSATFASLPDSLTLLQREAGLKQARRERRKGAADASDSADAARSPRRRRAAMDAGRAAAMSGDDAAVLISDRGASIGAMTDAPMAENAPMRASQGGSAAARAVVDADPDRRALYQLGTADIAARYRDAATTPQPFVERLVRFWSNHFAVSIDKGTARLFAAPMEREAIRPHVLGRFEDLLLAVETHPAMLRYLDNVASVGSDSPMVQRQQRRAQRQEAMADGSSKPLRQLGLNENLAREIMELHTLGVHGGYRQDDVTEFARAITGWGVPPPRELADARSAFLFRDAAHEPGARQVLGKRYADEGEAQGRAILRDLARHPATAQHLSLKLARHFVSDTPSDALVQRMARAYTASGGELRALYGALIDDPLAWAPGARKFKTPDDFVVSAMRAGGFALDRRPNEAPNLLRQLGQPVFTPRSPAGYPDAMGDWAAGDALRKRLQVAGTLARRVAGDRAPLRFAQDALGAETLDAGFATALQRAGSPQDGYALLFASPAFQWRT